MRHQFLQQSWKWSVSVLFHLKFCAAAKCVANKKDRGSDIFLTSFVFCPIAGLDSNPDDLTNAEEGQEKKRIPYSKPIPKSFVASWNDNTEYPPGHGDMATPFGVPPQPPFGGPPQPPFGGPSQQPFGGPANSYGPGPQGDIEQGAISLHELQRQATAVVAFGNVYPVLAGSNLYMAVLSGEIAVKDVLRSEFLL